MADDVGKMSFEQAMAELEQLVNQLDGGEVPLEESIALYERGAKLREHCDAKLRAAEERVEQITLDAGGRPTGTRPADAQ
ncbi:exodeoxyribonuclease VII small subunit [Jannaschia sp. W003]|uniref:exodeoxyribonuclease VII small subunit n=1 Tax=Jannaschia sp. W003 TaxID=2867012 RepID=UPI0021A6A9B5|nr:exodeoxyribonuclease VII small subunit [Jannaschia sp. W003]UWQ22158.1 exodeoxyribonuclease VII small subunit [Jannaschia sp. W003]